MHVDRKADPAITDQRDAEFFLPHAATVADAISDCASKGACVPILFRLYARDGQAQKPLCLHRMRQCIPSLAGAMRRLRRSGTRWRRRRRKPPFPPSITSPAAGGAIQFEALDAPTKPLARRSTGIAEFDRALGGGIVPGSAMLMGGEPGIGKSTLLLQAAAAIARAGGTVGLCQRGGSDRAGAAARAAAGAGAMRRCGSPRPLRCAIS